MSEKPETKIVNQIIQYIKDLGGDAWKVHGNNMQRSGEPDIDGWLPSSLHPDGLPIHLKVEVKTPIGKPSKLQLYRLKVYKEAGYYALVAVSVDDFRQQMEDDYAIRLCGSTR